MSVGLISCFSYLVCKSRLFGASSYLLNFGLSSCTILTHICSKMVKFADKCIEDIKGVLSFF